jgi:hypothetical protein
MLASINPLGERGRNQSYPITVTAYLVASLVAAAVLGAALGAVGASFAVPVTASVVVVAALALAGLLLDGRVFGSRVPGPRRQVNEEWLSTYRGWVYGAGFGAQLGFAFTTIVAASATWVAFVAAFGAGSAAGGALIGATFGVVRALPVFATARSFDGAALRDRLHRVDRARPRVLLVAAVVQAALAVVLLVGLAA